MSAFIIAACRTPVCPRGGALSALSPEELAAPVIRAVLAQAGIAPDRVDDVIVSNALGAGGNPARRVALAAGLPERVPGLSIDRQCAGGLDAILLARAMVLSGAAEVVVAGGVESYSRRPLRSRTFADGRPPEPYEQAPFTPWPERDPDMTEAAAALADQLGISRAEQDRWAVESHARARAQSWSDTELVGIGGQRSDAFTRNLTVALAGRARAIAGSVTPANAAVAADAAGFVVVVSERIAQLHSRACAEIVSGATRGTDPEQPGLSPLPAIKAALASAGIKAADLCVAEVMEAYAVQAIACVRGAGLDPATVNPGGGALARGHPIGASGAINAVRLYHALAKRQGFGLATIAAAGGIGSAMILRPR